MYGKGVSAIAILGLCGCAAQPVDNSPSHATSKINAKYVLTGAYVPDFNGVQTVYTRPEMRRIHNKTEFDSFFMRRANSDQSSLFRIDQKKLYELDHKNETYMGCPISGCTQQSLLERIKNAGTRSEDEEEYRSYDERGCKTTLASNTFEVKDTGQTRILSGLDANEYTVDWKVEFKDQAGKVDMNHLRFVFWTTTPTADMQQAWKVHRQATDNYLTAKGDDPWLRLLGKEGFQALSAFTGDIEKADRQHYVKVGKQLATIKGYPLSIKAEWFQKLGGTCDQGKSESSAKPKLTASTDLAGMAKSMVGSFLDKKRDAMLAEWNKEPRIRYIYEITGVQQVAVKDSVFELPQGYKMEDRQ